jgi:hypothetical protein
MATNEVSDLSLDMTTIPDVAIPKIDFETGAPISYAAPEPVLGPATPQAALAAPAPTMPSVGGVAPEVKMPSMDPAAAPETLDPFDKVMTESMQSMKAMMAMQLAGNMQAQAWDTVTTQFQSGTLSTPEDIDAAIKDPANAGIVPALTRMKANMLTVSNDPKLKLLDGFIEDPQGYLGVNKEVWNKVGGTARTTAMAAQSLVQQAPAMTAAERNTNTMMLLSQIEGLKDSAAAYGASTVKHGFFHDTLGDGSTSALKMEGVLALSGLGLSLYQVLYATPAEAQNQRDYALKIYKMQKKDQEDLLKLQYQLSTESAIAIKGAEEGSDKSKVVVKAPPPVHL